MSSVRNKARRRRQKTGLVLILVSLICFGVIFFLKLSPAPPPEPLKEPPEASFPIQILIPKVKINLPVSPAKAEGENWEISQTGASYLLGSGIPGQKGNVVIFGHNKNSLLGPVRWLVPGDQIKLINQKNEEFIYKVIEKKTVSSKQIDILTPSGDARLTLYTCSGFLDKERLVLVAKLQPE